MGTSRKRSVDSGELSWILCVGVGEAVQVCRGRGGLKREFTHGEVGSWGNDGSDRHVGSKSLSKNSTDCENIFAGSKFLIYKYPKIAPNHPVFRILFAGVKHWLSNQEGDVFTQDIRGYPTHLLSLIETVIRSQARIGWYPVLKGFLSEKWRDLASMDLLHASKKDDQLGAYRMMQLVKMLYAFNSSMWKSRNEILHSTDPQTMADIRSTENAEIRHNFQNPGLLAFNDRHLCVGSQDSLLTRSASTRRRWLRRVKLSCELARRDNARQSLITSFFVRPGEA